MRIFISPYSKQMRNGKPHPKVYPYWEQLIEMLPEHELVQIGVTGERKLVFNCLFDLPFKELRKEIDKMDTFISVDNFFPHFCHYYDKHGIVIWGQSNPAIFGYKQNINTLRDVKFLRSNQFQLWEQADYIRDAFVTPDVIARILKDESSISTILSSG